METRQFEVGERSNTGWRIVRRLAVFMLLTTAYVVVMQSNAFASGGLSSVILANSEPGLVAVPLGTYNGPITQSDVDQVMGSSTDATSALGQSLENGTVTGYIRTWSHQPSNGDAVVIAGFQFTFASNESSFLEGLDAEIQSQSGSAPLAVAGIPDASGFVVHTSSSGTPLSEYVLTFAKGNAVFQVAVASSSGDLTSANAVALANQQFANAPDIPASTASVVYRLDWWKVGTLVVGAILTIAVFIVGRKRKYPMALSGLPPQSGPNGGPSVVVPSEPQTVHWSPAEPVSPEERPKVSSQQWQ